MEVFLKTLKLKWHSVGPTVPMDTNHRNTPEGSMHFFLDEWMKTTKNTLCCNVELIRKKFWVHPRSRSAPKVTKRTHSPSKFHGNPFSSICVFVLTYQPTYQQADTGKYITSLAKVLNWQIKAKWHWYNHVMSSVALDELFKSKKWTHMMFQGLSWVRFRTEKRYWVASWEM